MLVKNISENYRLKVYLECEILEWFQSLSNFREFLVVCPAGQFLYSQGCERCPQGTYKSGPGNGQCDACLLDRSSPVGSTSSNDCCKFYTFIDPFCMRWHSKFAVCKLNCSCHSRIKGHFVVTFSTSDLCNQMCYWCQKLEMTSGKRPRGKRGQIFVVKGQILASFHSSTGNLIGLELKEVKRGVERGQIRPLTTKFGLFCPSASYHLSCDWFCGKRPDFAVRGRILW